MATGALSPSGAMTLRRPSLADRTVPAVVLEAGRERPEGSGAYVDFEGVETPPF
jgi:hypothetical protein